ncbi:bifunctional DNA primase/polymerase [Agrobacterium cavarae]|uniref:bifunctional DNA primase/polymerase n=1 Tax=Agrobacterium cavarae TaxID=2528239 RepID=UPI002FF6460F
MKAVTTIGKQGLPERNTLGATSATIPEDSIERDADLGIMHHPKLSHVLTGELFRLHNAGFSLLPLGLKREPLVKFSTAVGKPTKRLPLSLVIEKMAGAGSANYAIRLDGLLVVDVDTDTPEARSYVERRFGNSAVQVKSPRGIHHYYQHDGKAPKAIRLPGISIDFKAGCQSLIAGPYAERADGQQYLPLKGKLLSVSALPLFTDNDLAEEEDFEEPMPRSATGKVARGDRHQSLKKRGMQLVHTAEDEADLFDNLRLFRDWECDFPEEVPDSEIVSLARWFWFKRCNNEIWGGRNSPMGMTRASFDQLINVRYGDQAWLLYSFVHSNHEHVGREFSIVPEAILAAGKLQALSKKDIYRAAKILVDQKLLSRRTVRDGKTCKYLYRIAGGRERGRSVDYIHAHNGNPKLSVIEGGQQ